MAAPARARPIRARPSLGLMLAALPVAAGRAISQQWIGSAPHLATLGARRIKGFATAPRDARPADPEAGQALLAGTFAFAGQTLELGPGGDPWDRAMPSRAFAVALHRMDWLGDLMATGEAGQAEAVRLVIGWRRLFGQWNRFSWAEDVLERRVVNLALAGRRMTADATEAEAALQAASLARQAKRLLQTARQPDKAAERLAGVAIAGAALTGPVGNRLLTIALPRLAGALDKTVLADGVHATRSPEAGMALLFDLMALDDGLVQRGRAAPEALPRAIDRLTASLRFFTLADGRLASFQGGEASSARTVSAARAHDEEAALAIPLPREAPHGGYQRMDGRRLGVIADAGAPGSGPWSLSACGQPLAIEVTAGRERLITNTGWSAQATGAPKARLASAGSTTELGGGSAGAPLDGLLAFAFGPRLVGAATTVDAIRRESEAGVWIEMEHHAWVAATGLTHERRLFLDKETDELRGEDRFVPSDVARPNQVPVAIRFHLPPDVTASIARDQRSVMLSPPSGAGWWLRNDAGEVSLEPTVIFTDGLPQPSTQVVLRGRLRADRGGRVRWKLSAADEAPLPLPSR